MELNHHVLVNHHSTGMHNKRKKDEEEAIDGIGTHGVWTVMVKVRKEERKLHVNKCCTNTTLC